MLVHRNSPRNVQSNAAQHSSIEFFETFTSYSLQHSNPDKSNGTIVERAAKC